MNILSVVEQEGDFRPILEGYILFCQYANGILIEQYSCNLVREEFGPNSKTELMHKGLLEQFCLQHSERLANTYGEDAINPFLSYVWVVGQTADYVRHEVVELRKEFYAYCIEQASSALELLKVEDS